MTWLRDRLTSLITHLIELELEDLGSNSSKTKMRTTVPELALRLVQMECYQHLSNSYLLQGQWSVMIKCHHQSTRMRTQDKGQTIKMTTFMI